MKLMKKIALILSLVAFLGFAFAPSLVSSKIAPVVYSDTTKVVKKAKKTNTAECCKKDCCKSGCKKMDKTSEPKTEQKKE